MKNLIGTFLILFSLQTLAMEKSELNKILDDLQKISEQKLDAKKDLELVKKTLMTLIKIDDAEPSRTGPAIMATSFGKHEKLYKKAAKEIETKKNKQALKEILEVMKTLNESGNG